MAVEVALTREGRILVGHSNETESGGFTVYGDITDQLNRMGLLKANGGYVKPDKSYVVGENAMDYSFANTANRVAGSQYCVGDNALGLGIK